MLILYFQTMSKDICQRLQKILEVKSTLSVCTWSKLWRLHLAMLTYSLFL